MGLPYIMPIGTCRIHTPIRRARGAYPFQLDLGRVYGFVHSSSEALQQARYIMGVSDLAQEDGYCVFRPDYKLDSSHAVIHADLYLVEISSAKRLRLDQRFLQINYLYREFDEFFSDSQRTRQYWSLARQGQENKRLQFLQNDQVFRNYPRHMQDLLERLTLTTTTQAEISEDMRQILDLLGRDRVVFVTHVNARTIDGQTIKSREILIDQVQQVANSLGALCLNPTDIMRDYGQSLALAQGGRDLTHYSDAFSDHLWRRWFDEKLSCFLSVNEAQKEIDSASVTLIDEITEKIQHGQFVDASVIMTRLSSVVINNPVMLRLRAEIASGMGLHDDALILTREAEQQLGVSHIGTRILMRAMAAREQWEPCANLADGFLADEIEDIEVLCIAVIARFHLGQHGEVIRLGRRALRIDNTYSRLLPWLMRSLAYAGNNDDFETIFLLGIGAGINEWHQLSVQTAVARCDANCVQRVVKVWMNQDAQAILIWLIDQPMTSSLIGVCRVINEVIAKWEERIQAIVRDWRCEVGKLIESDENDRLGIAYSMAHAIELLDNNSSVLTTRVRRHWKQLIVNAMRKNNGLALRLLLTDSKELLHEFPELVWRCVQICAQTGQPEFALQLLIQYISLRSDVGSLRILGLRLFMRGEDYVLLAQAIKGLWPITIGLQDASSQEWSLLCEFAESRLSRWVRALLQSGQLDEAWHLSSVFSRVNLNASNKSLAKVTSAYLRALKKLSVQDIAGIKALIQSSVLLLKESDGILLRKTTHVAEQSELIELVAPIWLYRLSIGICDKSMVGKAIKVFECAWPAKKILNELHALNEVQNNFDEAVILQIKRLKARATLICRDDIQRYFDQGRLNEIREIISSPGLEHIAEQFSELLGEASCNFQNEEYPEEGKLTSDLRSTDICIENIISIDAQVSQLEKLKNVMWGVEVIEIIKKLIITRKNLNDRVQVTIEPWINELQSVTTELAGSIATDNDNHIILLANLVEALSGGSALNRRHTTLINSLKYRVIRNMYKGQMLNLYIDHMVNWIIDGSPNSDIIVERLDIAAEQVPLDRFFPQLCLLLDKHPEYYGALISWMPKLLNHSDLNNFLYCLPALIGKINTAMSTVIVGDDILMIEKVLDQIMMSLQKRGLFIRMADLLNKLDCNAVWHARWKREVISHLQHEQLSFARRLLLLDPSSEIALSTLRFGLHSTNHELSLLYERALVELTV